jgi:pyruvate formate lyase activating enzyme
VAVVFNLQRFSTQDGPGLRTTVFLKGCPLRCLWCSNPESQNEFPEIAHRTTLCKQCGTCEKVCDLSAIKLTDNGVVIDRRKCTNCGKCADACVYEALKMYGREMDVYEVYAIAIRDKPFYGQSGGGVTVSGGEPMVQAEFVAKLFELLHNSGIHTCIESCGQTQRDCWDMVMPYTDLVLYDVKILDSRGHRDATGSSNETILNNLAYIAGKGAEVIVRIPIVPGYTDSQQNLAAIAEHVARVGGVTRIELLSHHRLGESKYAMLDRRHTPICDGQEWSENMGELTTFVKGFNVECECVI